ncbi:MAG: hypothetical protein A2Y81_11865 [Nitrospirae bacterium RBG_13_43_8]|nr:MAG: hypothetical protein A2Y81_11865 [Nitrospirae bacterium RBG_13_43_8]
MFFFLILVYLKTHFTELCHPVWNYAGNNGSYFLSKEKKKVRTGFHFGTQINGDRPYLVTVSLFEQIIWEVSLRLLHNFAFSVDDR